MRGRRRRAHAPSWRAPPVARPLSPSAEPVRRESALAAYAVGWLSVGSSSSLVSLLSLLTRWAGSAWAGPRAW